MLWISTLCILAVAAWLFFNALNERRWIEAHKDEEGVSNDPGLIPGFHDSNSSTLPEDNFSISQSDSSIARMAVDLKKKTTKLGESIERKAAAKFSDNAPQTGGRSRSELGSALTGSESLIGRYAERLSKKSMEVAEKLPVHIPRVNQQKADDTAPKASGGIGGFIQNISDRIEKIDKQGS